MKSFAFIPAVLSALPLLAKAATIPEKVQAVRNAVTHVDKINALEDNDFAFDFKNPDLKKTSGAGGYSISANIGNFAGLVESGLALTIGHTEPCGGNSPHTHPRASEVLLLLNGTLTSGFLTENGSRFVVHNMTEKSVMVFPKGSVHFQMNYNCEPVEWVAALSNEDPGTLQIAQRFFSLSADVVGAALGGLSEEDVTRIKDLIPDNLIAGMKECYERCKLPYPKQNHKQTTTPMPMAPTSEGKKVIDVLVGDHAKPKFSTDDIMAKVGDTVRFHFKSGNFTVTQTASQAPCMPIYGGFDSGYQPVSDGKEVIYDVVLKDDKPMYFYSNQKAPDASKNYCQMGMNGAINAPKDGDDSLKAFKDRATKSSD